MKAYFEVDNDNLPINTDVMSAIEGFQNLAYDIKTFKRTDILTESKYQKLAKENVFVGSIDSIKFILKSINKYPEPIDFPQSIIDSGLLNREIKISKLKTVINIFEFNGKPIFIKPLETKIFDGILISKKEELNYFNRIDLNEDVIVTDKIDIKSEWRVYVRNNLIIYAANYSGDFKIQPDYDYVKNLIYKYTDAPVAYTIDVAILRDGSMTVVEFNDFWAIGNYGLIYNIYSEMLKDRWFEIIS